MDYTEEEINSMLAEVDNELMLERQAALSKVNPDDLLKKHIPSLEDLIRAKDEYLKTAQFEKLQQVEKQIDQFYPQDNTEPIKTVSFLDFAIKNINRENPTLLDKVLLENEGVDYQARYDNEKKMALEEIQAKYPDAVTLDDVTFYQYKQEKKHCQPCATCKSYPCAKTTCKGFTYKLKVVNGEVSIFNVKCRVMQAYQMQVQMQKNFGNAQIPKRYIGKGFTDYEVDGFNKNAVNWAKYIITAPTSFYLYGLPGTGKTFLASIIAQEFIKQGKSTLFSDFPTILDALKSTFGKKDNNDFDKMMNDLVTADILFLDDLGVEMVTEWAVERLYLIINSRYNADRPVIVTSNYNLSDLSKRLSVKDAVKGQRIASRLKEMCKVAELRGRDRRL